MILKHYDLASAETFIDFASVTENFDYDRDIRDLYEESARRAEKKSAEAQVVKRELADPSGREPVSLGCSNHLMPTNL